MADIMKITKSRMTAFADQARRLGGVEGELSPAQIESTLAGVAAGGSGGDSGQEDALITRTLTEYTNSIVESVGDYAFANSRKLTKVNLPVCKSIGFAAFKNCNLSLMNLPVCEHIGSEVFELNRNLSQINAPMCVDIGMSAFQDCGIHSVDFPLISKVDVGVFSGCYELSNVNASAITLIGTHAFHGCENLTAITSSSFPLCTNIGQYAFSRCISLSHVEFPAVSVIYDSAFYSCSNLTYVNFPACKSVSQFAFHKCEKLTTVKLPECMSMGRSAFDNCSSLSTISLPKVSKLDSCVFVDCISLTSVELSACTKIGSSAFKNCYNLSTIVLRTPTICELLSLNALSSTPYRFYSASFSGTPHIYVPASLVDSYKTAANWSYLTSYFSAVESLYPHIDLADKDNMTIQYNSSKSICVNVYQCNSIPEVSIVSSNESIVSVSNIQTMSTKITFDIVSNETEGNATVTITATFDNESYTEVISVTVLESIPAPIISIESVVGAEYGFELNDNDYYESTNKGVNDSYSICKINIIASADCMVYLDYINYAEDNYDYGILSTLDNTLSLSSSADSTNVQKALKYASPYVETENYNVPLGEHFIYVKFIKDSSDAKNNDSLQFKVRYEI